MIRASAYHLHPRGVVVSLLQLVQLFPRHLRVIELVSEVQGTFLVTSNTHGVDRLEPPPEAKVERCRSDARCSTWSRATRRGSPSCCASIPSARRSASRRLEDVLASIGARARRDGAAPPEGRRVVARRARAPEGPPAQSRPKKRSCARCRARSRARLADRRRSAPRTRRCISMHAGAVAVVCRPAGDRALDAIGRASASRSGGTR